MTLMMMRLQKARHCREPRVITGHECALMRHRRGESVEGGKESSRAQ
jgi:hypothetical protein